MRVVDCVQGSGKWLKTRTGLLTASRISEAMSKFKPRGKESKANPNETEERWKYRVDMMVERITGNTTENFNSPEMVWGTLQEPAARTAYEMQKDVLTQKVGFILHPLYDWAGASPDAILEDGGLELKAPKSATHVKWYYRYINQGIVPPEHQDQVLWNMACAEREWWDFGSFDPRIRGDKRLIVVRMFRDEERIKAMTAEAVLFNEQVEEMVAEFGGRYEWTGYEPPVEAYEEAPPLESWAREFSPDEVIP